MLVLRWTVSCALVGGIFSPDSPVQDAFAGSTEARLGDGEVPHEYTREKMYRKAIAPRAYSPVVQRLVVAVVNSTVDDPTA